MWRSLVAHTHGVRGVAGSNPVIPTFAKINLCSMGDKLRNKLSCYSKIKLSLSSKKGNKDLV